MQQIWITKNGRPEVLETRTAGDPIPGNGTVRIRVTACGVNFDDILGRLGLLSAAPDIPYVPGYEVAGVVDKIGQGVTNVSVGDAVFALTRFGGYADYACVSHKHVFKRYEWLSDQSAAALPVSYLSAYVMLMVMGSLRRGNRVLIHNAGSGVGLAALDICKIMGATTYGTASPHKHDFLTERGLDHPIDYRNRDYALALREITAEQGVDLILDPFGGDHWAKNYELLRPTGRLICFGHSARVTGKKAPAWWERWWPTTRSTTHYSPPDLMRDNRGVLGFDIGRLWSETGLLREAMTQIVGWYDEALFRPHIDTVFPLEKAADAHHYIQDRKNIGKILLIPPGGDA